ncbi:MAG: hypothetical protein FVQ82_09615 [Planctomycetes bacterium]|nr:hypothetical protein [Planctomycetota bacterium]
MEKIIMMDKSVLKEFRNRRKPLANVNAKSVDPRIRAFIKYCKSVPKIGAIIQNHFDQYPTLSLLEGTSNVRPPQAGTLEEIASIGLYLMYECSHGERLNELAGKHGIVKYDQVSGVNDYVSGAMEQYIDFTLDFLEDRIKEAVEMPVESEAVRGIKKFDKIVDKDKLEKDFTKFLDSNGYSGHIEEIVKKGQQVDLCVTAGKDAKPIAIFGFALSNDSETLIDATRKLEFLCNEGLLGKPDPFMFIVCPGQDKSSEAFEVYKINDKLYQLFVTTDEFPPYEVLRSKWERETKTQGGDIAISDERKLCTDFTDFLNKKKGYNRSNFEYGLRSNISRVLLDIIDRNNKKQLAVVGFGLSDEESVLHFAHNTFMTYIDDESYSEIKFYLVLPGVADLGEEFIIHEFHMTSGDTSAISCKDFPRYEELKQEAPSIQLGLFKKFRSGVDIEGSQILDRIIVLAADPNIGLYAEDVDESYANLRLADSGKRDNVVAQIHKYGEYGELIALAVVGPMKGVEVSEPKLNDFIDKGKITELSGYKKNIPGEKAWLNGNLPKKGTREKITVYVIHGEIVTVPEQLNALGEILNLGVENVGGEKAVNVFHKLMLKVFGKFATLRGDEVTDVDALGRDVLIDAFADTLIATEFNNGFTLSLMGNWGEGKSSVMEILKKKLRERGRFWAIYKEKRVKYKVPVLWALINSGLQKIRTSKFDFALFNAWEYEQTDNLAAGMAQEVVRGLKGEPYHGILNTIKCWLHKFWLAFCFNLIESRWDIFKFLLCGTASCFLYYHLKPQDINFVKDELLEHWPFTTSVAVSGFGGLWYLFKMIISFIKHPLPSNLEKYFKLPNYSKHLGLVPVLKGHIKILCKLKLNAIRIPFTKIKIGKDRKLLLFVDDLDRCKHDCIAETLDAIRLVMPTANVIVMICIDHRIAFKAVERHYHILAEKEDGNRRTSAAVARDYLGKIIQIPVTLEPIEHEYLRNYVYGKLFDFKEKEWKQFKDKPEPVEEPKSSRKKNRGASKSGVKEPIEQDNSNRFKKAFQKAGQTLVKQFIKPRDKNSNGGKIKDTPEEGVEFYRLAGLFEFNNPRQLLRLHNSFRFLKALGRGGDGSTLDMLQMLFWQEFLHNWPMKVRGRCMAALVKEEHVAKIEAAKAKKVLENVREEIAELFNKEGYQKLAEFVRVVVLPHNEEGVLDSAEAIEGWMGEEERKRKEKEKKKA